MARSRQRASFFSTCFGRTAAFARHPVRSTRSRIEDEALPYIDVVEEARSKPLSVIVLSLLITLIALIGVFLVWASATELEEITRGSGKVVPSSRIQQVQSLDGGIIQQIYVAEGARVGKGQLLVRLDDTRFSADLGELKARRDKLEIASIRLRSQAQWRGDSDAPDIPKRFWDSAPEAVASELDLFRANVEALKARRSILDARMSQKQSEWASSVQQYEKLQEQSELAKQELELKKPLAAKRIIPKTDMLKLQRELSDLESQLAQASERKELTQAAIDEINSEREGLIAQFQQAAQAELNDLGGALEIIKQTMLGADDKMRHRDVRAPVSGIVNTMEVNTVGGVVRPSQMLLSIVPLEDTLQVEVQVHPKDIAFVRAGQKALVKLSAYDFTVYGGLNGVVVQVSPDTVYDEEKRQAFYVVTVRTNESALGDDTAPLPIIPGMLAAVDVLTGKKTVMSYMLSPLHNLKENALRER
ncbi:HlyD family type I secretion periplasmic adaptor subunit [Rhodobacteraceae bacterium RKSG542]|uniref:HlyD family type I secretion periplasmic adaptor subunit n=1 Tax=Pseudovibrio flavus TaxID=2529854 RepID=UPI0012BD5F81|nr:HlyD family type I secretion periplasmic adaptor subunit [Pseudovibrio flavus]MTI16071.1 HlyD family type I secretion periplasmic adaptor subunit [Pseudovibrio flavus]